MCTCTLYCTVLCVNRLWLKKKNVFFPSAVKSVAYIYRSLCTYLTHTVFLDWMASIPKTSCIWMLRNSWWCSHWVIGAAAIREVDVVGLSDVFRLVVVRARQPCICKLDTKRGRGWGANYCLRGTEWKVLYRMTFVEICSAMVSHALIHVQTIVHPLQCCLLPEFRLFLS